MRVTERMKKWISMILCLCMLAQNAPMMVFAASTDNLCEHHPKHTEDCGYVEAVAGSACTHKHSEACYEIVDCKHTCSDECGDPCTTHTCTVDDGCITMERDCHHVHGECGYAEAVEPQDCTTCQPVLVHAENCGYVESADEVTCDCEPTVTHGGEGCTYVEGKDGSPCTHVCAVVVDSDDSCYKLLCSHKDGGHDDACGYAAAVEGHACHYECSACEDNAGDDSPVPEGVCAHGNSEESCETCVGEIQVMINALPDMEDIGDHNRADVISQLEAIDDRMWKLSDAAKGKLNADKYVDAAFVLSAPEGFFGFLLTKRYEAGASAMPQASFAFLDASGVAATVITPEEQQTTSVEPASNGAAVRGYLPVGEYTLDETVVGDWNLAMSVNGQAEGDHTFTGEGGRAYRIETVNVLIRSNITIASHEHGSVEVKYATGEKIDPQGNKYSVTSHSNITLTVTPEPGYVCVELKVMRNNKEIELQEEGNTYTFQMTDEDVNVTVTFCSHTTENAENQATCTTQAVCDLCGKSYGDVNKKNHDETVEYDNGFCSYCGVYQSATQNAEGYYEISNAGQLYWFAEQVNSSGNYSINGKLMEDILVNENVLNSAGIVSSGPFRTWYPIGSTEDVNYSGIFNGNGKTISGLYFNDYYVDGVGLFGYVDSGKIQNVGIKDSYFNGRNNVGSVVAHNHQGTVTGCYNTGTVSGGSNVGGVVGKNDKGTVTDCYNSGRIGSNDCNNVGGVLGGNIGTVSNCYNTGSISGRDCVGGVAGYSNGSATNCYNTGEVYGQNMVGGVLGLNEGDSTLSNCYNTGTVFGGSYVGGVAGKNDQGTIDYCYYLTGSTTRGIGEGNGTTEDKTAEAFASGEVAYLLGEPFGQNIDNDQTKQEIPCFSNAIVYAVKNCKKETVYSNTNENIGHKWENGKCSICDASCSHSGSQHTTGTSKDEGTHSYTCSICSSVATENHTFNSATGKCQYCKTEMAVAKVEIGGTPPTYFKTLADAVTAAEAGTAEAPATLTLLKDIDQGRYEQLITSGVFTLDLNGCTLEGSHFYVLKITGDTNGKPDVTITDRGEGGTISATNISGYGVYAENSTVEISGGTITGTKYGVHAYSNSTVTISGGTVIATGEDSYGSYGVYADSNSTVTISSGTVTATGENSDGVHAYNSTVEISGGTITGTSSGVYADSNSTVTISGGTITGDIGVYAYSNSTMTITGGTITGGNYDLQVIAGSITLGLGKDDTGATFPEGLTVFNTTLKVILGERAAYWQNDKMLTNIADNATVITDGDVTVKAECKHENADYPSTSITDDSHEIVCSCGYNMVKSHTFDSTTGKCQYCKTEMTVAKVEIGGTPPTYFETLDEAVTAAKAGTAEAPATLTLLKDINLGESDQQIDSGVFTLDLNGCKLEGSGSRVLNIIGTETHVTITDDSDAGAITNTSTSTASYCNGVRVTSGGIVTITGGTISASDYGVYAISGAVTITGGTITGVEDGVYAEESTVTISGGKISATGEDSYGVYAYSNSAVTISDGTISATGEDSYGVNAYNSTVKISGGTITGDTGVYVNSSSTMTISGGSISANAYGVHSLGGTLIVDGGTITGDPGMQVTSGTLTISGGTIISSGESAIGVNVLRGIVTITGGTISGYCGVCASINSTVEITGGEISGNGEHSVGVYADESTVKISGGEISATGEESSGVYASVNSNVTISDGTITGTNYGVEAYNSTVTISGGEVSATDTYSCGVYANKSTVKISGGEISGEANDLRVLDGGSITLGLGEDKTGATFPGDLKVSGTTLKACLGEGAAYWQGTKMLTDIAEDATEITEGTVTVKAVCKHENPNYSGDSNNATEHKIVCSECDNVLSSESHTLTYTASGNVITYSCSECKATFGTAIITANDKTYNGEPVTAAVQKTGVLSGSNIGITYSQNGEELNESVINAGTYTASIKLGDAVAKVNFTITPATLPNAVLSETGYTYNGQQQKPDVTVNDLKENTDYTVTYPQDVTNAGEKTVTITGKGNYTGTVTKSYTIAKADSVVTKDPQAAANLVYNGKNQNLVIAGTVTGGTLRYSLDGKTWTATIPVGKAAGTYTVSYKVVGDGNHKDIAVRTLAVTIAKGTAPAVDALVQTHFYAYATANTVDLAKYLPADRGTTAYTAIGVSADIFSSVLTVTNAGVLSYTTRKLTAAPASDTQIRIRTVMENYADAELTVTVKLLAVTEQTQQKIVKTELTEVPAGLAGTRFHSVDAIKTEQTRVLGSLLGYDPQGNILHYDVKLQFSPDGGKTWVDATEENFPANGLTVTLPYPSGTGKDTHNFVVSHMFTTGAKAGNTETPAVTKTADGIRFAVTGLSPVSVACSAIPFDVKVANVTNGTVYVSPAHTAAGTQVTITATPKSGYRLSSLAVKDAAGNSYTVSTDNNGKYYFIMPAVDVTVTATFTAKSTAVADTTNPKTGDDFPILFWSGMMMTTLLGAAALMLNKQKFYER